MPKIQNKEGINLAGIRNGFMPAAMERLSKIALWNSGVSMILILAIAAIYLFRPVQPPIGVTPDGKVVKLIALTEGVDKGGIMSFADLALRSCYALDFVNWEKQIGGLAPMFTDRGYNQFLESVQPLKDRVVDGRYISVVSLVSPAIIVKSGIVNDVLKYKLRASLLIGFEGQGKRIPPQTWDIEMMVERVPLNRHPAGVQISYITAKQAGGVK